MPRFKRVNNFNDHISKRNVKKKLEEITDIFNNDMGVISKGYTLEEILGTGSTTAQTETVITGNSTFLSVNYDTFLNFSLLGSAHGRVSIGIDTVKDQYPNGVILSAVTEFVSSEQNIFQSKGISVSDIRIAGNWYDIGNQVINTGIDAQIPDETDLTTIANHGFSWLSFRNISTATGHKRISEILDKNPNWNFMIYLEYANTVIPEGWNENERYFRPWLDWQFDNQSGYGTLNTGGTYFRRNQSMTSSTWVNYMTAATPGYTFNKDLLDEFFSFYETLLNQLPKRPIAVMADFFNDESDGYPEIPGYAEALDLDQDGVEYKNDTEEQISFRDAQYYYLEKLRQVMGDDCIILGNGRPALFGQNNVGIQSRLNGPMIESFPELVWNDVKLHELLLSMYSAYTDSLSNSYSPGPISSKPYYFITNVLDTRDINETVYNSERLAVDLARCTSLMFEGWYSYETNSGSQSLESSRIVDDIFTGYVEMLSVTGVSLQPIHYTKGGIYEYFEREYPNGRIGITLNNSLSGTDQIVSVYVEDKASQNISTGRHSLVDLRTSAVLGQDKPDGSIDTGSPTVSQEDLQTIADIGYAYFSSDRFFTKTGQWQINNIKALNPDFKAFVYIQFGHVSATYTSGDLSRPWDNWEVQNLPPASGTGGTSAVAWWNTYIAPGDPGNEPAAYWVNYGHDTGSGYELNYNLCEAWISHFTGFMFNVSGDYPNKPIGMKWDYFNPTGTGYFIWSGEDPLDLNQDGVEYSLDSNEQSVFRESQLYLARRIREEMGSDFFITANGKPTWPTRGDKEITQYMNGFYLEGFPTTPWFDPATSFAELWELYDDKNVNYIPYMGKYLFHTDLRAQYDLTDIRADAGRAAALLYDGWWRYRPLSGSNVFDKNKLDDIYWTSLKATLGNPIGNPNRIQGYSGNPNYECYYRDFEGGLLKVVVDSAATDINQIVEVSTGGTLYVSPPEQTNLFLLW